MEQSEKMLTLSDFCNELSISAATAKNWLKLGKISCSHSDGKNFYFSRKYVDSVKSEIFSAPDSILKSRRNKKFISGNNLYKSYISKASPNSKAVAKLNTALDDFKTFPINLLLAECALRLKFGNVIDSSLLRAYILKKLEISDFHLLIDDLIDDLPGCQKDCLCFIESNSELFNIKYTYEPLEDTLGFLYISLRNMTDRKATGAYYTPATVVNQLIDGLFYSQNNDARKVIDPCCGTGNFLLQLPENVNYNSVYGNDLDSTAIKLTRINMSLKYNIDDYNYLTTHFTCSDFLTYENGVEYDYIIGNPPWGYYFTSDEKYILRKKYKSANIDYMESYTLFIEKALQVLRPGGLMSFVLPVSILNVKAHRCIRQLILDSASIRQIDYLGNIFDKVWCPSIILKMERSETAFSTKGIHIISQTDNFIINTERNVTSEYFSFNMTDRTYELLSKIHNGSDKMQSDSKRIYLIGGATGNADFGLGIVTGGNNRFISTIKNKTNEEIIKGTDIQQFKIGTINNYIDFLPDLLQQTAPEHIYRTSEKLVYRFIGNRLVFALDTMCRVTLNSCNVLIPRISGLNIRYILAVLNSPVCQFVFYNEFNSVKVLRSHIEQLPIPAASQAVQNDIVTIVDKLIQSDLPNEEFERLRNSVNKYIAKLYNLTDEEYSYINKQLKGLSQQGL